MFTPVSCVFEEAGGQFDNEDNPEEGRPNCLFVLTSRCFSDALKHNRTAGDAFVCFSQSFPRVKVVCALGLREASFSQTESDGFVCLHLHLCSP